MRILAVCGSLQARSSNLHLLQRAIQLAPRDVELRLFRALQDLPHFNPDLDVQHVPPSVAAWRAALAHADGVLIACPEYGFSLPGSLKNAIDWVISSGELTGKVVAITAAVSAPERGRMGLQALRQTLNAVAATIVGGEPIARGDQFEQEIEALLASLIAQVHAQRSTPGES